MYYSKLNTLAKHYSYNCRVKFVLLFTVRPQMSQAYKIWFSNFQWL